MTLPQAFGKDSPDRCIDMQERYIRRKDSASLYGIAIIMMVFHHLFCIPSRLGYHYIPVTGSFETEARIAWLGKMCVGIFAFVTGYAHAITAARDTREDHITNRFIGDVQNSLRWLVKFYSKFWLCAQPRVCSLTGGNPVYPRPNQPDISESWDGASNDT